MRKTTTAFLFFLFTLRSFAIEPNVVAWGDNSQGQTNVPAFLTNVVAISAVYNSSFALTADGQVVEWGAGKPPITFPGSNYIAISGTIAVQSDGTVIQLNFDNTFRVFTNQPGIINASGPGFDRWETLNTNGDAVMYTLGNASLLVTNVADIFEAPLDLLKSESELLHFDVSSLPTPGFRALTGVPGVVAVVFHDLDMAVVLREDRSLGAIPQDFQKYLTQPAIDVGGYEKNFALTREGNLILMPWSPWSSTNPPPPFSNVVQIASGIAHNLALIGRGKPHIIPSATQRTVPAGSALNIYVRATGELPMIYEWRHDGVLLPEQTSNLLRITSLQTSGAGTYELRISNAQGTTAQSYEIAVPPITIVLQPKSKLVAIKSDYILSIEARGLDLQYQWQKDGLPIPGATNAELQLHELTWSDAGAYQVRVSNENGSVLSNPGQLKLSALGYQYRSSTDDAEPVPIGMSNVLRVYLNYAVTRDGKVVTWSPFETGGAVAEGVPFVSTNIVDYRGAALTSDGRIELTPGVFSGLSNIVSITPQGLALVADGTVVAYQDNFYSSNLPPNLHDIVEIEDGLAIHGDGTVTSWTNAAPFFPGITVPEGLSNVVTGSVSVSGDILLFSDGLIRTWLSLIRPVSLPYPPESGTNAVDVYISFYGPTAVLLSDGTITAEEGTAPPLRGVSDISLDPFIFSTFAVGEGSPIFEQVRTNRTGQTGVPLFLKARAFGEMPIYYQWRFAGHDVPGETNIFLKLLKPAPFSGAYDLVASNAEGIATNSFNVSITNTPDHLSITSDGNSLVLEYSPSNPLPATYELLQSTDLANWSPLPITPAITNGTYRFELANTRAEAAAFFKIVGQE